ncbi:hypothetical protein RN001_003249 [Aquatica leii]|uniref:Tesmin/TSO1-like CXC domain-containing protein n=1 Tax=Aquatica leii TaxID=1421715 RepID=A0AAN7SRI9_9COLE|nr:hypothetical protein RN001_003249 [Aquatica leii]
MDHLETCLICEKLFFTLDKAYNVVKLGLATVRAATRLHFFRVYVQVQIWHGKNDTIKPINWGWPEASDVLIPVPSTTPPAPDELLHLITCNCKTDYIRGCECRKAGLACSQLCGRCRGTACKNHALEEEGSEDEEREQS